MHQTCYGSAATVSLLISINTLVTLSPLVQLLGCDLEAEAGNGRIHAAVASGHVQHQGSDAAAAAAGLVQRGICWG